MASSPGCRSTGLLAILWLARAPPLPVDGGCRGDGEGVTLACVTPPPSAGSASCWQPDDGAAHANDIGPQAVRRLVRAGAAELLPDGRLAWCPDVDVQHRALIGLGRDVVLCLESAAAAYGWPLESELLHLTVPRTRTRARWPGSNIYCRNLASEDSLTRRGLPLTTPELTVIDLARWRGLRTALIGLDAARHKRHTNPRKMRRALAARVGQSGVHAAWVALSLSSEVRQSPIESEFRYLVHAEGLPAPVDQYEVCAGDLLIGRVDFAWPEAMVVVEIDGYEFHREYGPFQDDRRRDRALRSVGWHVLRYTKADLKEPKAVAEEVRAALQDRGIAC